MITNGTTSVVARAPSDANVDMLQCADISVDEQNEIRLASNMDWFRARIGQLPAGANILMSGDPGVGKSTLALQVAAAAATAGERVLYLATEQTADSVHRRLEQVCGATRMQRYMTVKDDLYDLSLLPQLLANQLLRPGADLFGTRMVVIDSLQGCGGVSAQDKRMWGAILDYLRQAGGAGITTISLAHMTKGRSISGPRTLEHACDVTMLLRYGASCRAMMVPKNRFGPAQPEPYGLAMDATTTRLEPSPLGAAATSRVRSMGPGGIVELEVAITPVRNDRGFIKSPGLSTKEVETVVDLVERTFDEARFLWAMGVTVRGPDGLAHRRDYNLAVAMALLSALRQTSVPRGWIYVGDLGLQGEVRAPSTHALAAMEDAQAAGALDDVECLVSSAAIESGMREKMPFPIQTLQTLNDIARFMEASHD